MRALILSFLFALLPAARASCGCREYDAGYASACVARGSCPAATCLGPNAAGGGDCTQWQEPLQCSSGFYNSGAGASCVGSGASITCSLGTCLPCTCDVGQTATTCDSVYTVNASQPNLVCTACSSKPAKASYTTANSCDWVCPAGSSGPRCDACPTTCVAGRALVGTCTQTPNGAGDTAPTCAACGILNALSYSSGCTVSRCIDGYQLVSGLCVDQSPPPAPPPSPPQPPQPPSPNPPPPPKTTAVADCANTVVAHYFGVSPVYDANGLLNEVLNDAYGAQPYGNVTGTTFNPGGYAVTPVVRLGTIGGAQFSINFVLNTINVAATLFSYSNSALNPTYELYLKQNTNNTLTVESKTPTSAGRQLFTTSTTFLSGVAYTKSVVCGSYLSFCFLF